MSMREDAARQFAHVLRGYDRAEVDEYVAWIRNELIQADERAALAETALAQSRRELASSPTTAGISQRLAAMLQLANEEANDIRTRARAESEATTRDAADQAERTIDDANRERDAIRREIDELSAIREGLVQRLIELGGEIAGATEHYRGFLPGTAPVAPSETELFDAEADEDARTDPRPADDAVARADVSER